jgi:hypothetical protein
LHARYDVADFDSVRINPLPRTIRAVTRCHR